MLSLDLHDPKWYQAVTLTERLALQMPLQMVSSSNAEVAGRWLKRWRSRPPLNDDRYFARWLEVNGLTQEAFLSLLAESTAAVRDCHPVAPDWLKRLAEAFSRSDASTPKVIPTLPLDLTFNAGFESEQAEMMRMFSFLNLLEPLLQQARERLREGVRSLTVEGLPPDFLVEPDAVEKMFLTNLLPRLLPMLGRTLVLELNVARLQGLLDGENPEERFKSFVDRLTQPEVALSMLGEYPVLARQLMIAIDRYISFVLEFLQHLCADWPAIRAMFCPEEHPGQLIGADLGQGDSHRGGRSVIVASFSNHFQLVYKPKSMAPDVHFQELLAWLNQRGATPQFRLMKVIDRDSYGWSEFVTAKSCDSEGQIRSFYERQGSYLALLYAIEATDFHYENLIAVGEHPVLIDLEALFHPRFKPLDTEDAMQVVNDYMAYSVLRVGLLPTLMWASPDSEGVELSGLGALPGQLTPTGVPLWEKIGTDEMHLIRKRVEMAIGQNRPTLNGAEVSVIDYSQSIVTGFTRMYRLLLTCCNDLLADDGPLTKFSNDEMRVIIRPTRIYGLMLRESFHPDLLRNAFDRDLYLDRIWAGVETRPYLVDLIPAELEDLQVGDIPMFTTRPGSRDLWTSTNQRIPDFLSEPSLDVVRRSLRRMSEGDLKKQLWFINASLTTLAPGLGSGAWRTYKPMPPRIQADRRRLLAAACTIGDRLEELALHENGKVSWLGLTLINERRWALLPLGIDLYGGLSGVALFLAYLGDVTGQERYTALAKVAWSTIRTLFGQLKPLVRSIGAFDGWGGIIYAMSHLGVLWKQPEILDEAAKLAELIPGLIDADIALDIVGGSAGCIGSLAALYRAQPSEQLRDAAVKCGDHLLSKAKSMEKGIAWITNQKVIKPLAGFSHGASGMAWAFLQLHAMTGDARFRTSAVQAMAYEQSLFSLENGNWADWRDPAELGIVKEKGDNSPDFMLAWCHGAPGIGLARVRALQSIDTPEVRSELDAAIKTTLKQGFGLNHSLCHGDAGNIDFILQASEALDDRALDEQVKRYAAIMLESLDKYGWLCGTPNAIETPGLLTGIAGIGYELLRLAEPKRIPSVLVLAPASR